MLSYVESFSEDDRMRLFGFLALFARWECALKSTGYVRTNGLHHALADWNRFATDNEAAIAMLADGDFVAARTFLLASPPKQQVLNNGAVEWRDNPRRPNETDAMYLFRVVKDVRNNLFHGGKFVTGFAPELARDRALVDHATRVLESAASIDQRVLAILEQGA
jgi:hypothetical protein